MTARKLPFTSIALTVLAIGAWNLSFLAFTRPGDSYHAPMDALGFLDHSPLRTILYALCVVPGVVIPFSFFHKSDNKWWPTIIATIEVYAVLLGGYNHFFMFIEYSSHIADGSHADTIHWPSDLLATIDITKIAPWLTMTIYMLASLAGFYMTAEYIVDFSHANCLECKVSLSNV